MVRLTRPTPSKNIWRSSISVLASSLLLCGQGRITTTTGTFGAVAAFTPNTPSNMDVVTNANKKIRNGNRHRHQSKQRNAARSALSVSADDFQADDGRSPLRDPPKLIVFDLDNTLWTPELYQLRRLDRAGKTPLANKDVSLFPGSRSVLKRIEDGEFGDATRFGVASRTSKGEWANDLLDQFQIRKNFPYIEIFPSNKRKHFANIAAQSGIGYHEMLFFDDARGGRYGNCEPISELGVLCVHCASGIDKENVFDRALQYYQKGWDGAPNTIIEWDGSVTNTAAAASTAVDTSARQEGTVKTINYDKRYGFINYGDRNTKDLFFHFSALPSSMADFIQEGDSISFGIGRDGKTGKSRATDIQASGTQNSNMNNGNDDGNDSGDKITVRAFSMNLPFAALLASECKTLETRNGTMFVPYPEGTFMLLHVGQRIYPDGGKHMDILRGGGMDDAEIERLKSLPKGFRKGNIVAICELGKTYETTEEERNVPDFQRKVGAYGSDSGRIVTEIKRAAYLKRPINQSGNRGVFKAKIDPSVLPDGWLEDMQKQQPGNVEDSGSNVDGKTMVYSISG